MGVGTRRLAELAGLPDWPLLMTESVAAAYLSLAPNDFARDVETGRLPPQAAALRAEADPIGSSPRGRGTD